LGEIIPEYNSEALEMAVRSMAAVDLNKYQDGLKKAKEDFIWENEEPKLKKIYQRVRSSDQGRS